MKKNGQAAMIGLFITVVILAIVGSVSWSFISSQRDTTTITDDQFTATNGTCIQVTDNCISSTTKIENVTLPVTTTGNFSLCGVGVNTGRYNGYLLNIDGADASIDGLTQNASYNEASCSYVTGTAGTIISYISIALALVLLAFVAGAIVIK